MQIWKGRKAAWAGLVGCSLLLGCATNTPSVRALRMYQHEEPTFALMHQHIHEMGEALSLINTLLNSTPYWPGAPWVSALPLNDQRAERAKAVMPNAAGKASFVAVYATHVQGMVNEARRTAPAPALPPGSSGGMVSYPAIFDALTRVHPNLVQRGAALEQQIARALNEANQRHVALGASDPPDPDLLAQNEAIRVELAQQLQELRAKLARPLSPPDTQGPANAQIIRDAIVIVSVASRLADEAISLGTVVGLEATALAPPSAGTVVQWSRNTTDLVAAMPAEARRTQAELQGYAQALRTLLGTLSQLNGVDPHQTPGYEYEDGLVDEIVGVGLHSVHVDIRAGAEALYYSALADDDRETDGDGNSYDYTGRQTRLEYDVEPIVLATGRLSVKLDWPGWAEAAELDLGYATNRMYKSGGDIRSGSLASELGVPSRYSQAFDGALSIAGIKGSVRIARFTHGTVRDVLIEDGSVLADAPLTFELKQIGLSYDLAPRSGPFVQSLTIGFKYFDYQLPRILYELVNSTPDADTAAYVFSRETPPQAVRTRYYMLSMGAGIGRPLTAHFTPYLDLDVAFGYGPTKYYFLRDDGELNVPSNQEQTSSYSAGMVLGGGLGVRWTLGGRESIFNVFLDAAYRAQAISTLLGSNSDADTLVETSTTDLFHGPMGSFGAMF